MRKSWSNAFGSLLLLTSLAHIIYVLYMDFRRLVEAQCYIVDRLGNYS
jgi:hypothetical protein